MSVVYNSSDGHTSNHTATSTIPSSSVAATNVQAVNHSTQLNIPFSTPTQPQATTRRVPNPSVRQTISTLSPNITVAGLLLSLWAVILTSEQVGTPSELAKLIVEKYEVR